MSKGVYRPSGVRRRCILSCTDMCVLPVWPRCVPSCTEVDLHKVSTQKISDLERGASPPEMCPPEVCPSCTEVYAPGVPAQDVPAQGKEEHPQSVSAHGVQKPIHKVCPFKVYRGVSVQGQPRCVLQRCVPAVCIQGVSA